MIKNIMKNIGTKSRLNEEQRKKWEEKAANASETIASLSNFIASMSKPEAKANPHADEIVEIYEKEIEKRNKDPKYRPEKVYEAPEEVRGDLDRPKNDYISSHNTTKNLKNNHPYADDDDIKAFYEEEIKGRGNGTEEAAKEIFSNYGNTSRYFDEWYKRNRNKKWYAETKAREK